MFVYRGRTIYVTVHCSFFFFLAALCKFESGHTNQATVHHLGIWAKLAFFNMVHITVQLQIHQSDEKRRKMKHGTNVYKSFHVTYKPNHESRKMLNPLKFSCRKAKVLTLFPCTIIDALYLMMKDVY